MFVKSNFENNEMTGIAFKMDRLTPEEIKISLEHLKKQFYKRHKF